VVDPVERRRQIGVEDPPAVRVAARYRAEDRLDRIVAAAARAEAVGLRLEPRFPLRFQRAQDNSLEGSVPDHRDGGFIVLSFPGVVWLGF
jgi:hypothetical protein